MTSRSALLVAALGLAGASAFPSAVLAAGQGTPARLVPRTPDGRPNLEGIWQVRNSASADLEDHAARVDRRPGLSVVDGGPIPYQPWALTRRRENRAGDAAADPLSQCFLPGVPRIMYLDFPFQIFQTRDHVAMAFEWQQVFRLIPTNGSTPADGLTFWMGDSRGRWDGDALVVEVTNHDGRTWLDRAGNFHSDALSVTERYLMIDADTIQYEATIADPKVFTRPWTMRMPLHRHRDMTRVLEYQCRAEMEEASGNFEREPRTWYSGPESAAAALPAPAPPRPAAAAAASRPNLSGLFQADAGGANWGFEKHNEPFTPGGRGVLVEPLTLPYQPWARDEKVSRNLPERGYDDPTAHCFVGGVPRAIYVPSPFHIVQTATYVVILHERMSWRIIPLDGSPFLPDTIRLWMGDSRGRWEGSTLVVETRNLNGKTWLNEVGDVLSHAAHVVERFTPVAGGHLRYEATVTDPIVYTRPWTIAMPLQRQKGELLEVACLEDNQDLKHLKDIRDAARRGQR